MVELNVIGMTCGGCVRTVTQTVKRVDPEAEVRVDLPSKRVQVEGRSSPEDLIRALGEAGYLAHWERPVRPRRAGVAAAADDEPPRHS